jgi:hypothetical protein
MTKRILSIVALTMMVAIAPLSITTSASELNCRVPFSFMVNGKSLAPGSYTISTHLGYLMLTSGHDAAFVMATPGQETANGQARLVFLKTGERYALVEVWSGDGGGAEIPAAKREVERRLASKGPAERVVVLADTAGGSR